MRPMESGHFTRLSGDECRHLVRGHSVGRVVWLSGEGLQALPVTYVVSGERIYFRVDPESVLGELARSMRVLFEVDDIDVPTATGWSVVVRGRLEEVTSKDHELFERVVDLAEPWNVGGALDKRFYIRAQLENGATTGLVEVDNIKVVQP